MRFVVNVTRIALTVSMLAAALATPSWAEQPDRKAADRTESAMHRAAAATDRGVTKAGKATGKGLGIAIEKTGEGIAWMVDKTRRAMKRNETSATAESSQ